MKERPILMSAPMVRAVLEDRKLVTRRVVMPQPTMISFAWLWVKGATRLEWGEMSRSNLITRFCPYGVPGDLLWVKETFTLSPGEKPSEKTPRAIEGVCYKAQAGLV